MELIETGRSDQVPFELQRMSEPYGIPLDYMINRIDKIDGMPEEPSKKIKEYIVKIRQAISAQILYLPTYRRIERELSSIFEEVSPEDFRYKKERISQRETDEGFIELVEFGMKDVQKAIERELSDLKDFARENLNNLTLRYLGDVVNKSYESVGMNEIADLSEDTVRSVLDRIDESILTKSKRNIYLSRSIQFVPVVFQRNIVR
jgi:peptide subunit release factor 1 (eRF1)